MTEEINQLEFDRHQSIGEKLKTCYRDLEQVRAEIIATYPKSSKKEEKQLDVALERIQLLQAGLHGRLLKEFSSMSDDDLLPVYLGRI